MTEAIGDLVTFASARYSLQFPEHLLTTPLEPHQGLAGGRSISCRVRFFRNCRARRTQLLPGAMEEMS